MGQMTVRADDRLLDRVRRTAAANGRSMNEYVTAVLDAATNPNLASTEAEQVRARLALAGLLAPSEPRRGKRPDPDAVAAARRRAGKGTPLSQLVSEGR